MPLAGFTVAQGKMQFAPVVVAVVGTAGGTAVVLHEAHGREALKLANRYGKWLGIARILAGRGWFNKRQ